MLFNSVEFVVFLLAVLLVYHGCLPRDWWRARKIFLTLVSHLFYASWSPRFDVLLIGSTVIDFVVGLRMERATTRAGRRALLLVSLGFNLGVLGFFKYGAFVAANLQPFFGSGDPPLTDVFLPIGISFYTFE